MPVERCLACEAEGVATRGAEMGKADELDLSADRAQDLGYTSSVLTTASQARQRSTRCQPHAPSLPARGSISAANEGT